LAERGLDPLGGLAHEVPRLWRSVVFRVDALPLMIHEREPRLGRDADLDRHRVERAAERVRPREELYVAAGGVAAPLLGVDDRDHSLWCIAGERREDPAAIPAPRRERERVLGAAPLEDLAHRFDERDRVRLAPLRDANLEQA